MLIENKCENCGGDGLINQGDSIKFTCAVCMGTGKSVEVFMEEERDLPEVTNPLPEEESSFLGGASAE